MGAEQFSASHRRWYVFIASLAPYHKPCLSLRSGFLVVSSQQILPGLPFMSHGMFIRGVMAMLQLGANEDAFLLFARGPVVYSL
jgi:hypothetical protein